MKKISKLLVLLLIIVAVFSFTACKNEAENTTPELKSVTLFIVDLEGTELAKYERETEASFVSDLFVMIASEPDSTFAFSSDVSFYGQFVKTVTVSTDANWVSVGLFPVGNQFCAFYHTLDDAKYRDYTIANKTHSDKTFFFAGTGISTTPLVDGASYMCTIDTY